MRTQSPLERFDSEQKEISHYLNFKSTITVIQRQLEAYIHYLQDYLDKIHILDLDNEDYLSFEEFIADDSLFKLFEIK